MRKTILLTLLVSMVVLAAGCMQQPATGDDLPDVPPVETADTGSNIAGEAWAAAQFSVENRVYRVGQATDTTTIHVSASDDIVLNKAYYYTGTGNWQQFSLSGTQKGTKGANTFLTGDVEGDFSVTGTQENVQVAVFACSKASSGWNCYNGWQKTEGIKVVLDPLTASITKFTADKTSIKPGETVTFTINAKASGANDPTTYQLNLSFGDSSEPVSAEKANSEAWTQTHTYSSAGTYAAELTVSAEGSSSADTKKVTITVSTPAETSFPDVPDLGDDTDCEFPSRDGTCNV